MTKYMGKTVKATLGKTRIVGEVIHDIDQGNGTTALVIDTSGTRATQISLWVGEGLPWKVKVIEPPVKLPTGRYALVVPPSDNQEDLPFVLDIDPYDGKLTWFFDGAAATAKTVKQALRDGWTVEYAGREEK